jgi:hypothetical protein
VSKLPKIRVHGSVVIGVIVLTLLLSQIARQNIADLRSYSDSGNVEQIAEVNSFDQKVSFDIGDICKPLDNLQHAVIINVSGYLENSDDDVEILSMTNSVSGIRLVVNEARQPIIYLSNPNLMPNVKGYELLPPASELFNESEDYFELSKSLNFTIRLFRISESSANGLLIQTTTDNPSIFSRLDLVSDLQPNSIFCNSTGSIGHVGSGSSINATFSSARVNEENIGVLRNLRARAAILVLTILSTLLSAIWVRQRSTFK